MEQRWGRRRRLNLPVKVYHRGVPVATCQSRDIGPGGMFVVTGPLNFFRNTPLVFEIRAKGVPTVPRRLRVPGLVVHNRNQGVGVVFDTFDSETLGALQALLLGAPSRRD